MFHLEIKWSTTHLQNLHCSFSQSKVSTIKIKVCWMFPNPYRIFLQSWSCNNLTVYLVCNNQQERHQGTKFSTNQGAENSFYEGFEEHENQLPHLYLKQVPDVSEFEYECQHHVCVGACMLLVCVYVCIYKIISRTVQWSEVITVPREKNLGTELKDCYLNIKLREASLFYLTVIVPSFCSKPTKSFSQRNMNTLNFAAHSNIAANQYRCRFLRLELLKVCRVGADWCSEWKWVCFTKQRFCQTKLMIVSSLALPTWWVKYN
jgi:hypothetical protein